MTTGSRAWLAVVLGGLAAFAQSCSNEPRATLPTASDSGRHVQPAADLRSVIARTSTAFRWQDGVLGAGGASFVSTVSTRGAIAVKPRRGTGATASPLLPAEGTTLTLETESIARGARVLASGGGTTALESDGSVVIRRGAVVERIANDGAGVEQSWTFERAPEGDGDLVVSIASEGQTYSTRTDHGLHFTSADGAGLGLRYGTATFVDADGKRTTIAPSWAAGKIALVVPAAVIASARFPAVLDPTVTPEKATDQPAAGGSSASSNQYNPSIVALGANKGYLAVWYDYRGVRPAIFGARIATDGTTVIDTTGIAIATGVGGYNQPQVATSGNGFLVTWAVSYLDTYQAAGVYGVRLDGNAAPLDPTPVVIQPNVNDVYQPSAAFDGTNWLVTWYRYTGYTNQYDVEGARLPNQGAALDATPIGIAKTANGEETPKVVFDGTDFFVAYRTYSTTGTAVSTISAQKVGKDGTLVGGPLLLVSPPSIYNFDVAFDGTELLVVWSGYVNQPTDIFGKRVSKAGVPDAAQIAISVDAANYDDWPRTTWDGTNFLVTFSRNGALWATRVSGAGALVGGNTQITPVGQYYNNYGIASDGAASVAVDSESSPSNPSAGSDVLGVKIAKTPAGATPFVVSKAANSETEPAVAWNGTTHYAAWLDTRDQLPAIYGATLGPDGSPGVVKQIQTGGTTGTPIYISAPNVASDGQGFLAVFYADEPSAQRRGIRGVRINGDGTLNGTMFDVQVTPYSAPVPEYDQNPDVAFDGANYLVVWDSQGNDGVGIAGVRIPKGTTTAIEKIPLRISPVNPVERRTTPSIAFDGQNYFVGWATSRPSPSGFEVSHISGTRVSKDGAALDGETVICNAFLFQRSPQVAADTTNGGFMAVWEDYRTDLETADVYGVRVSATGANVDGPTGFKIAAGAYDESRPHVAPSGDGTNWVVAWRDLRSKSTYDIYGAWVSLAGRTHDPDGFLLSAEPGDEDGPRLSSEGGGKLLLAYQRLDPSTGFGSYRIRARAIDSGALVGTNCAKNDDCASRSCVDGFCCSTECDGCGVCNVTKGTCTPRAAGDVSPTCPAYKCKGTVDCPTKCDSDADCTDNASCDPSTHTCISRIICIDDHTLRDLSGNKTECAPFKCIGDSCKTQCGSVDDCATGYVCDPAGRCVQPPNGSDGGCAVRRSDREGLGSAGLAALLGIAGIVVRRRRR